MSNTIKGTDLTLSEALRMASDEVYIWEATEGRRVNMDIFFRAPDPCDKEPACMACLGGAAALEQIDLNLGSVQSLTPSQELRRKFRDDIYTLEDVLDRLRCGLIEEAFGEAGIIMPEWMPPVIKSGFTYKHEPDLCHWYWLALADMLEECGY